LPGTVLSANADCATNTVLGGDPKNLECHGDTCDFEETIAAYAKVPVYGYCYQGGEKSPGKVTLTDADECVSCNPKENADMAECKNTGDRRLGYTVTVFCR
jgi:hypothetical protein